MNIIGPGDALFSAFIHIYNQLKDPYRALQKAIVFASCKSGEAGVADAFVSERQWGSLAAAAYQT